MFVKCARCTVLVVSWAAFSSTSPGISLLLLLLGPCLTSSSGISSTRRLHHCSKGQRAPVESCWPTTAVPTGTQVTVCTYLMSCLWWSAMTSSLFLGRSPLIKLYTHWALIFYIFHTSNTSRTPAHRTPTPQPFFLSGEGVEDSELREDQ